MASTWILVFILNGVLLGEGPYFREACLSAMMLKPIEQKPTCIKVDDPNRILRQVPLRP